MSKKEQNKLEVDLARLIVASSRVVNVYDKFSPMDAEHFKLLIEELRRTLLRMPGSSI